MLAMETSVGSIHEGARTALGVGLFRPLVA